MPVLTLYFSASCLYFLGEGGSWIVMVVRKDSLQHDCTLTKEWVEWIAENLALSVPEDEIVRAMAREGIHEKDAEVALQTVRFLSPVSEPTSARKMRWILDSLSRLDRPDSDEVEAQDGVSVAEFYRNYYFRNQPVILDWKEHESLSGTLSWTELSKTLGNKTVEIQAGRSHDPQYERNSHDHKQEILFEDFLKEVVHGGGDNETYLTANNGKRNGDAFSSILGSREWIPGILDPDDVEGKAFLWIGPGGTVTQLHHDLTNNLLLQVTGSKLVYLFPPSHFSFIYNDYHCYSDFDCESPDFEKFPLARRIPIRKCVLEEGNALFLPVGWWHQVRSLSPSISITAVNFQYPNDFGREYETYHEIS